MSVRRPSLRSLAAWCAAAVLAAGLAVPVAAAPAAAATPSPDPLLLVQGGEVGQLTCSYSSEGVRRRPAVQKFVAAYPQVLVKPVAYSVCDLVRTPSGGYVDAGSAATIIDTAAASLAAAIAAIPARTRPDGTQDASVDVFAESLGTVVSRQCLLNAYRSPSDPRWAPCRRIDDWIGMVPPSRGTYVAVLPPVTEQTCRTWGSACKRLSSGPHLQTQSLCGLFLPAATKVCGALHPNSEFQRSIAKGAPGVPDETPGPTSYTTVYSYSDEFVLLNTTTGPGAPHPSPLEGATNVLATYETHTSVGDLVTDATGTYRPRIAGVWTSVFGGPRLTVEAWRPIVPGSVPATVAPFCTEAIGAGTVKLLDDTVTTAPTPLTTPVIATC